MRAVTVPSDPRWRLLAVPTWGGRHGQRQAANTGSGHSRRITSRGASHLRWTGQLL